MTTCPGAAAPPRSDLVSLLAPVAGDLARVEAMMAHRDVTNLTSLRTAYKGILARGGKRLRPAMALLCAGLLPDREAGLPDAVIALAAAVEMLHTATLVHDDVIDGSALRRGAPTLNSVWSRGSTVLAGNYMFGQASHFIALTGHARVIQVFSETLRELVEGEILQMHAMHEFQLARNNYFHRIACKTSSIFRVATEGAALLQNFSTDRVRRLKQFGVRFGLAFQVVDDILDYTGDQADLGKPAGSDLLSGHCTLPFFLYVQGHPDRETLIADIREASSYRNREPAVWADRIRSFVADVCASDAIRESYRVARGHVDAGLACLDLFPDSEGRQALTALGHEILRRRA